MSAFQPFGPESVMWRVNRERLVLLGGPAAAVLQVAHPQVAMGVAAHSRFRSDTAGRLHRTLEAVYTIAFGTAAEVESVRASVARAHRPVKGAGYSAFDPDAQWWVLATLIMGSVTLYERFVARLAKRDLDGLLEENARFGEVFGLDPGMVPRDWGVFEEYWHGMLDGPLLGSHPLCGEVARAVVQPEAPWYFRHSSAALCSLAAEFIPLPLQNRLGLTDGPRARLLWPLLDGMLPGVLEALPPDVRFAPHYRRALRRLEGEDLPAEGLEPTLPKERDFESRASANSATPAS